MTAMGRHSDTEAAVPARKDHLWVLFAIGACAQLEVFPSWVGIGALSAFPVIGGAHGIPTDWTLAVVVEAYWSYALWMWLTAPAAARSRRFAMWSAGGVLAASVTGQCWYHLVAARGTPPPAALMAFVAALPLIVFALAAVLIHLRHLDREDAEAAALAAASALADAQRDAAHQAALIAEREAREAAENALRPLAGELETARRELGEARARAGELAAKLEALRTRNSRAKKRTVSPRNRDANSRATEVPDDVDARAEALSILAAEPGISGAKLGERVGKSARWGQLLKSELAPTSAPSDIVDGGSPETS